MTTPFRPQRLPSQLTYNDLNGEESLEILCDWFRQLLRSQPIFQRHLTLPMAKISLSIDIGVEMHVGGTIPVASPPERLDIIGNVTLDNNLSTGPSDVRSATALDRVMERSEQHLSTTINAAPLPGGQPPDQVREAHGLPVPRPSYGPRDTGSHLFLSDVVEVTDRAQKREGIVADGYVFAEEQVSPSPVSDGRQVIPVDKGQIEIDLKGDGITHAGIQVKTATHYASKKTAGDQAGKPYESVNGVYDAGPAGLARPGHAGGLYSDGRPRIGWGNQR